MPTDHTPTSLEALCCKLGPLNETNLKNMRESRKSAVQEYPCIMCFFFLQQCILGAWALPM